MIAFGSPEVVELALVYVVSAIASAFLHFYLRQNFKDNDGKSNANALDGRNALANR